MTDINKPVARPTETLVHLHFIDPDTQDRSTWIGESVSRGLRRSPAGRLVLDVAVDVGSAPESDAADTESAAHRLQALIDQAAQDGEVGDDTPLFDVAGYSATFGDLREILAAARLAVPATVWIYVDDDGSLSPVDYATRQVAQAHAEAAWRFVTEDDGPTPLSWRSAFAEVGVQTEDAADFDLIDEDSGVSTGWQVRRIRVVDEMPEAVSGAAA